MISHRYRCIFVHIQKTGGNSIRRTLGQTRADPYKHCFAMSLRDQYGADFWESYFKFAFVRNPWDRLVSWWEMIDRNRREGNIANPFQAFVAREATTFSDFLLKCDRKFEEQTGLKWIFANQIDYMTDEAGNQLVDFAGRFERLESDFAYVAKRLGLDIRLPHLNRSERKPYVAYYTPALVDLVSEKYQRDISRFGYTFGQESCGY